MKCDMCSKKYNNIFNTKVRLDYEETGKGKPYEWNLCLDCRKEIIKEFNYEE